ncbi:MAG: hypothetical protein JSS61_04090 [Verrucomicrobia bacterium]|nr:hypothetical protein [Verrucomicrobiota bacterium]
MRSATRYSISWLLFAVAALCLARFTHHQTGGFRISKIRSNLPKDCPIAAKEESPPAVLSQPFHYFGRGLQSFVFLSADGEYVLKLFNNRYNRKISLFETLSYLPFLDHWARQRASYYLSKQAQTFESYQIAKDKMAQWTAVCYAHLQPTTTLPQITLIDRLGIAHPIDPNGLGFILQKRAQLAFPSLQSLLAKGDLESTKQALSSLIHLFVWKSQSGIADNDPLIRTNYGFLENEPIQIDLGSLSLDPDAARPERIRQEMTHITASLKKWLQENSAELIPFLEEELEKQLSSSNDSNIPLSSFHAGASTVDRAEDPRLLPPKNSMR